MRLPSFLLRWLCDWHKRYTESHPREFAVGPDNDPYLERWHLLPRNSWFNIYVHLIRHDDDDRALHDHPYFNCSLVVEGGYWEIQPNSDADFRFVIPTIKRWHDPGAMLFRLPSTPHRLELDESTVLRYGKGKPLKRPARTIFITGPRVREWGFWCPQGWRHWKDFVNPDHPGQQGKGCGE